MKVREPLSNDFFFLLSAICYKWPRKILCFHGNHPSNESPKTGARRRGEFIFMNEKFYAPVENIKILLQLSHSLTYA